MTDPDVFLDIADLFPEPHLLLASDGTILAANRAFRTLHGIREEPKGTPLTDLVDDPEAVLEYLGRCVRSRAMLPGAVTLRDGDGQVHRFRADGCIARPADRGVKPWILVRLRQRSDASEHFRALTTQLHDLRAELARREQIDAERERLLADAREARASAEAASRLKDDFLSSLSHELRTPVNAILGWAMLLQDEQVENVSRERALEGIARNARDQTRMVEDLLDLSRMTEGKLDLDIRLVDLGEIVRQTADSLRNAARAKRIALEVGVHAEEGVTARGDARRLGQIVWHLLSNAVKFTPSGGWVRVVAGRLNGDAELVVEDSGPGIHPEFLPYVFDRFRQADQTMTRRHGGLGLGLAMVRHLVELHGGTVEAHSDGLGKGSRFRVYLPAGEPNGAHTHAGSPP